LPFLVAYIYFLPPLPYFLALLIGVGMLSLREFYVMYKVPGILSVPGVIIGGVLLYVSCRHPSYLVDAIFSGIFLLLFLRTITVKTPSGTMSDIGPLGIGFLYICGFLSFQWYLRMEILGMEYLFLLFTSVWSADSFAYYIGTYAGRNKLSPSISPNKTVEGAVGSVIGGCIGSVVIKMIFDMPALTISRSLFIGAILGAATIIGDLIESMFKRDAGVKDSGNLFPGHGGVLDKIDGMLVAGPVLYFFVRYF
jgi:phosphatidate cytidylyltransferase